MILETISSPADLKALDHEQLEVLASEIRSASSSSPCPPTAGHLGSNLGVVELTLALHRVFDSPEDIILWDTGHQAYPHKIVTGRAEGFAQLRKPGGLSGYPSRTESEHDWIENSHASTVLSWAYGLAVAEASPLGHRRRVIAVIGDGAMTGGMAFEGLNNLGHSGPGLHHHPQRQRPLLRPHRVPPGREPGPDPQQPRLHAPPGQARAAAVETSRSWATGWSGPSTPPRPRCASCGSRRRSSRASASATPGPSTATTSRPSRRRFATPAEIVGPPGRCTCSPRRAGATPRPRTTRSSASTTCPRPSRAATPRRSPRRSSRRPRPVPRWSPSPRPCRTPPACCPSPSASRGACSTSASPSSTPSPPPPAWRSAVCGPSWRSTRRSSPGPSTRSTSTSASTASPWSSASTGPASPATTGRATTACSTWSCSPRCRA